MTLILSDLKRPGTSLHGVLVGFARQIQGDIENLADNTAVRIHDIRVSTKKIRSLLKLAGSEISENERAALVALLRQIKNTFSGSRDEDVMRLRLEQIFPDGRAEQIVGKLGLAPSEESPDISGGEAVGAAEELFSRLASLDLKGLTPPHLVENAVSLYRRARKIMRRCEKTPDDDLMHEWRKRVKDVCYHAMALSALPSVEDSSKPLDALAESLGEYHDLALLGARAATYKKIADRVSAAKRKVGRRCFQAAKEIFTSSAKKFTRELDRALRHP